MPVLWPADIRASLPAAAAALCAKQKGKMDEDVACAITWSFGAAEAEETKPGVSAEDGSVRERYTHAWLLVNTRCFYWDYPVLGGALKEKGTVKRGLDGKVVERKRDRNDCLAMCPVLDYFNHTDGDGVSVIFLHEALDCIQVLTTSGIASCRLQQARLHSHCRSGIW